MNRGRSPWIGRPIYPQTEVDTAHLGAGHQQLWKKLA